MNSFKVGDTVRFKSPFTATSDSGNARVIGVGFMTGTENEEAIEVAYNRNGRHYELAHPVSDFNPTPEL